MLLCNLFLGLSIDAYVCCGRANIRMVDDVTDEVSIVPSDEVPGIQHRLFFSPRLLDCIAAILDTDEISLSPIQHLRPYIRARQGRQPWMLHEWQCVAPPLSAPAPPPLADAIACGAAAKTCPRRR